jgi:hypothetical protein
LADDQVVIAMTEAERERIRAESRRLLSDDEPTPPPAEPVMREVHIPERDPIAEWRAWHDERDAEREAGRAELKRQERSDARARGADWAAYIDACVEQRLAEYQERFDELANASVEFSNKVLQALTRLDSLCGDLDKKFNELRALEDIRRSAIEDIRRNDHSVIDMPTPLIRKERAN